MFNKEEIKSQLEAFITAAGIVDFKVSATQTGTFACLFQEQEDAETVKGLMPPRFSNKRVLYDRTENAYVVTGSYSPPVMKEETVLHITNKTITTAKTADGAEASVTSITEHEAPRTDRLPDTTIEQVNKAIVMGNFHDMTATEFIMLSSGFSIYPGTKYRIHKPPQNSEAVIMCMRHDIPRISLTIIDLRDPDMIWGVDMEKNEIYQT